MLGRENKNSRKEKLSFTLIELLVAISIFSVVATTLYATLYLAVKSYQRIYKEARLNQKITKVIDRLSLELRNSYNSGYSKENKNQSFIGYTDSISFFTLKDIYQNGESEAAPARITYSFKDGKLFKIIQRGEAAFSDNTQDKGSEVLSGIFRCNFKYLYFNNIDESFEWKDDWTYGSAIPKGVAIEIDSDGLHLRKRYILLMQGEVIEDG